MHARCQPCLTNDGRPALICLTNDGRRTQRTRHAGRVFGRVLTRSLPFAPQCKQACACLAPHGAPTLLPHFSITTTHTYTLSAF